MAKKTESKIPRGEVLERADETAKAEQYWILANKSEPHVPPKDFRYVEELAYLQIELIKMQEWVKYNRLRVCVIFEGRDAAGKGGVIKRITDPLNPRVCRVWLYRRRTIGNGRNGISSVTRLICPPGEKSCCSTGAGTTAP